ncbi:phosphoglycerate mutase-like protein [Sistotremastrum suecicum HHB10207 ss-3]|uniref:Phosphoglycerate mutase-like protein n=1 Tax=Sistotremastrum suecicum HHB10207 ss-3 TaxID=1314776 RepID=A0A166GEB3_9AGAM|nr:phosphoglycerate mutase-like protein [Sistotremastrum suecicum HHB10207 ss-3]
MPAREVPLDVDGYPMAPPELVLEQVHVYARHGERTPVGVRLVDPPASIPQHWTMCQNGRQFRAAVAGSHALDETSVQQHDASLLLRRAVERRDGSFHDSECMLGELTDIGRATTYNLGVALRKLYVDKLNFLPDRIGHEGHVYFRSTQVPRTIESLQQIVHGLYPTTKYDNGIVPRILIRNPRDENLLGNTMACRRLEVLNAGFAIAAAKAMEHTLEPLDEKLSKYIRGNPIRIDGQPRLSGIFDTVRSAQANGVKVPPEFHDKAIMDTIERAVVTEWFAGYKTEEFRRLAMGRLLDDLSRKMTHKADYGEKDPLKILIHSTHDTALAGLASTLDVFDERWPAFTASITFELFRKVEPESPKSFLQSLFGTFAPTSSKRTSEHFVRMRYQNRNLSLPFCFEEGSHLKGSPEFCTLTAFQQRVKELTPQDWEKDCLTAASHPRS